MDLSNEFLQIAQEYRIFYEGSHLKLQHIISEHFRGFVRGYARTDIADMELNPQLDLEFTVGLIPSTIQALRLDLAAETPIFLRIIPEYPHMRNIQALEFGPEDVKLSETINLLKLLPNLTLFRSIFGGLGTFIEEIDYNDLPEHLYSQRILKERGYDDLAETAALVESRAKSEANEGPDEEESKEDTGKKNMFDLLMEGEGHNSSESEPERGSEEKEPEPPKKQEARKATTSRKKGKGRGSRQGKQSKQSKQGAVDLDMDELQEHLEKLQAQTEDNAGTGGASRAGRGEALGIVLTSEQQQNRALLVSDAKHLDSEAEIKRLFGSAALKDAGRRLTLTRPKLTWPPLRNTPVEMKPVGEDAATRALVESDVTGGQWFAVEHSVRYQTVQLDFLNAVMTHDADGIAAIVYQHPYHVDALLQLSEIIKQTGGDFGEAAGLVERALYAMERGFGRLSVTNGLGRVDFRRIESRGLFLALFRHMQFMARRGCWRTAFEVNKVLLSLDPARDPYGALLTLDFHALQSKQYEYMRQFVDSWTWRPVSMMPNWAYSRALAEFMLESKGKGKGKGKGQGSLELLVDAILVFPTVVPVLWSKANVDVDAVVLTHPYFQDPHVPDESAMTHMQLLVQLFVERNSTLYRAAEVARWMQEALLVALERIATEPERKAQVQSKMCTYVVPENVSRHVLVADMDALKAGLPEAIKHAESYAFDPLPPRDSIDLYREILGGAPALGGAGFEDAGEEELGVLYRMINRIRVHLGGVELDDVGTSDEDDEDDEDDE
ncbi:transcriptional repressor TCF25-domain-containing protein [Coemansia spiralis]|nr:transcriptional repressor TCF25-domain-containing protein [Coemansia spiralis]